MVKQAYSTVVRAVEDEDKRWEVLTLSAAVLPDLSRNDSPAYNSSVLLHKVNEHLGMEDPYADAKKELNEKALSLVGAVKDKIKAAENKLEAAVRLSVAGNVLDLGIAHEADLEETIESALGDGFARFDYDAFQEKLNSSQRILYILDNAGELVFDKLVIDGLRAHGKMVVAAVKGGPVLNDATREDAEQAGLDKSAKVIDTGNNFVGVVRDKCSDMFLKVLDSADMVIAKGQGNYETLDESGDRFFFILKAKCPHIAKSLGIEENRFALIQG
jgi:uncharacterized protein with ATP-grasp and redox domains